MGRVGMRGSDTYLPSPRPGRSAVQTKSLLRHASSGSSFCGHAQANNKPLKFCIGKHTEIISDTASMGCAHYLRRTMFQSGANHSGTYCERSRLFLTAKLGSSSKRGSFLMQKCSPFSLYSCGLGAGQRATPDPTEILKSRRTDQN